MSIRRFYFTKESEWMRNVRREDKDGPWCRYEDVEPLLERIKELEKQLMTIRPMTKDEREAAREREETNRSK